MLQSLSWMYLNCQENMSKPGAGGARGPAQGQVFVPPGSSTASRVPWGLTLGCAGELTTEQSILSVAQGSLGTVTEPGEGHCGNLEVLSGWTGGSGTQDSHWHSSWKAELMTSNTSCAPWLAVTGGAGYKFIFFFCNTFNCVMNVGDQLKTCLLEWAWSWDFLVCESLWLLFLLDCQYFREGHKSNYTFFQFFVLAYIIFF